MKTNVLFILDKTGSMIQLKDEAIVSFNEYIKSMQEDGEDYSFSLVLFSSESKELRYKGVPVSEVEPLTYSTYHCDGWTPLYDTIGEFVGNIDRQRKNVIVVILTDGLENRSTEYTLADVKKIVADGQERGWRFVFMGTGFDAYAEGGHYGMMRGQTISFDPQDIRKATRVAYQATSTYAAGQSGALDDIDLGEELKKQE